MATAITYEGLNTCKRCSVKYSPSKSRGSSLPLTYCGLFCEIGDLGFSLEALEKAQIVRNTSKTDDIRQAEAVELLRQLADLVEEKELAGT